MKVISAIFFLFLAAFKSPVSFYDHQFTSIENATISMNDFRGKKVLIVVLPVTQTVDETTYLRKINSLSIDYKDSIVMIGIPSIEEGYLQDSASLNNWYRSNLSTQFLVSAGMYTKKASPEQNPLFRWLTDKNENSHFDNDVIGAGEKFFINENGELYGVFGPLKKLTDKLLSRMLF